MYYRCWIYTCGLLLYAFGISYYPSNPSKFKHADISSTKCLEESPSHPLFFPSKPGCLCRNSVGSSQGVDTESRHATMPSKRRNNGRSKHGRGHTVTWLQLGVLGVKLEVIYQRVDIGWLSNGACATTVVYIRVNFNWWRAGLCRCFSCHIFFVIGVAGFLSYCVISYLVWGNMRIHHK